MSQPLSTVPPFAEPSSAATPLDAPYYGASLSIAFSRFWKKYATFTGRASRSEFWKWVLVNTLVILALGVVAAVLGFNGASYDSSTGATTPGPLFGIGAALLGLWSLATLVPNLAITFRRLHDANFSSWLYLLVLIPSIGGIIVTVLCLLPTNPQGARFDAPRA